MDEASKHCICIDPASEKSLCEINYIEQNELTLDFILLTHEHTDHNWGVNALRRRFPKTKLVCSELCNKHLAKTNWAYFLLYYDDPDYHYEIAPAEILISNKEESSVWYGNEIKYILTPGHSYGSMCVSINEILFTGDTIMPYKPYFNGRDSNEIEWKESIKIINTLFTENIVICPGHGERLLLGNWIKQFNIYF